MTEIIKDHNIDEYFNVVSKLVRDAGKLIKNVEIDHVDYKRDVTDVVTKYDRLIESIIIKELQTQYPDHKFIAEETADFNDPNQNITSTPTWIIDPIDGTLNFVHSLPLNCISVGLAINKELQMGIVYNPHLEEFYSAIKGRGAFLNGKPIKVSSVTDLEHSLVGSEAFLLKVHKKHETRLKKFSEQCQGVRSLGCAALGLCFVARGCLDVYEMEYAKAWDIAAGVVILKEAGGIIKDTSGGKFNFMKPNFVATSTEELFVKVYNIIKESLE